MDPNLMCSNPDSYRAYIQSSKAEWSLAKQAYVDEGAVEGIHRVEADYARPADAARAIVESCFDSAAVLERLIGEAFGDAA
jgi:hypothetical protein